MRGDRDSGTGTRGGLGRRGAVPRCSGVRAAAAPRSPWRQLLRAPSSLSAPRPGARAQAVRTALSALRRLPAEVRSPGAGTPACPLPRGEAGHRRAAVGKPLPHLLCLNREMCLLRENLVLVSSHLRFRVVLCSGVFYKEEFTLVCASELRGTMEPVT